MILKSDLEKAVQLQMDRRATKSSGIAREMLEKFELSKAHILIITGIRRCGKSTLMLQLSNQTADDFTFFNFEDSRIFNFDKEDFPKLDEVLGEPAVYFFDEIQNIDQWEVFIRNLHDREKMICITGSNASLLSKELGTRLTGRNLQYELFPFSYSEFLQFTEQQRNAASFRNYLRDGGFPDYLTSGNKEVLQQLFKDIIYRDIVVRHGVRNSKVLVDIALNLISNVSKEYSLNRLANTFGVGSANSVSDYVQWFEDSYLLFSLPRFSTSPKSIAINPKKVYTIDMGFAQANSLSFSEDSGRLLENAVFLHLRRKYKDLYYFREKGECDFVVKEGVKITQAFQVCMEVHSDNLNREVNGLVEALERFGLEQGVIVTLDQEDELKQDGKVIRMVPAWKWFK